MLKKVKNIAKIKNVLVLALGFVIGVVVLSEQIYNNSNSSHYQEFSDDADPDDDDENNEDESVIIKAVDAVSSTVYSAISHQLYIIKDIFFPKDSPRQNYSFDRLELSTFFVTLFERIIPANAP